MKFTSVQIESAQTLPKRFTVGVLAAVTGTRIDEWKQLMNDPNGPEYETAVGGATTYQRNSILRYMHRNKEEL